MRWIDPRPTGGTAGGKVKSVPSIGVAFAPIPLDVMRRSDLSPLAKLVFAAVANQARMRRGDSTWTNAQIAAAVGMTASGVRRPLDELEAAGLIERRYGASERVRESIRIVYSPSVVGAPTTTPAVVDAVPRQPGCRPGAQQVGAPTTTPSYTKKNEEPKEASLSTHGGEDKPTAAEVAEAMRAMVAGRYSEALFEPKPTPTPCAAVAPPPNVKAMARRVGYSAVAAISQTRPPRKSQAQQLRELAEWSRRTNGAPPAPPSLETNEGRVPRFGSAAHRYNPTGQPA
jgi:DNA-binding Lrp family transcriptional regulator